MLRKDNIDIYFSGEGEVLNIFLLLFEGLHRHIVETSKSISNDFILSFAKAEKRILLAPRKGDAVIGEIITIQASDLFL